MPALLHGNKESRVFLLRHYRLSFAGGSLLSPGVPRVYFNFNIDVCFLPAIEYFDYTETQCVLEHTQYLRENKPSLSRNRQSSATNAGGIDTKLLETETGPKSSEALPTLDTLSEVDNIDDYLNRSRLVKSASLPVDPVRGNRYFFKTLASEKLARALEVKEQRVKSAIGRMWLRIQSWNVRNKMRLVSWSGDTTVVMAKIGSIWTTIKDEESDKLVHRVEEYIIKRVRSGDFLLDDVSHS
jgi:hypothetical protein